MCEFTSSSKNNRQWMSDETDDDDDDDDDDKSKANKSEAGLKTIVRQTAMYRVNNEMVNFTRVLCEACRDEDCAHVALSDVRPCKITSSSPATCDQTRKTILQEGNIGQTKHFSWVGVLRVHYHKGEKFGVGVTGIVLIKRKYSIANAYDVGKISKNYLRKEGKAMFILKNNVTWSSTVRDYFTHPEYEDSMYNTIALLELEVQNNDVLSPICLTSKKYNITGHLYAIGYTDEHMLLEKVIYNIQNVTREHCDEFYNRIGFKEEHDTPKRYHCGFAKNNKNHCVWENGMVLASNSSGPWVLIGFGIKGPGCYAPSRFIDVLLYLPWIKSQTEEIKEIY
ncbi:probable threonine protease PRSS50 [Bicyclus anynana]|uniref:Probable threonine protease PRSS50 n=1 Tax=Bicyclus anynana TaxID=110368 RepID=A0ABM3LPC9_BICAN|nr:probable threonine protease PRSS50 [Bicyclus anynana]